MKTKSNKARERGQASELAPRPREDWIPKQWSFDSNSVATHFERHVRQQLPWYDTLLVSIAHFGANYIPEGGLVYGIGASTGNVGKILGPTLVARGASLIAVEKSERMARALATSGGTRQDKCELANFDALAFNFRPFDFAVLNLSLMLMLVANRGTLLSNLATLLRPGGALVIVEKVISPSGYLGTVFGRLAMKWKLDGGTSADDVLAKELSLSGVQRPINPEIVPVDAVRFFQFGDFVGWIVERRENGFESLIGLGGDAR